jgi:hypothetical protein
MGIDKPPELDPKLRRRIEERAEEILTEDPRERSARTQRLLAERIAYLEIMAEREAAPESDP